MKKAMFVGLVSVLILSGAALAHQSGEEKRGFAMSGMMQRMMGGETRGGGMGGMEGMMGMMRMIGQMGKMMDECVSAHESMPGKPGQPAQGQKK